MPSHRDEQAPETKPTQGEAPAASGLSTASGASPKPTQLLEKATFYIRRDQTIALQEIKLRRLRQGTRIGLSELVQQAIDLLVEEEGR